MAQLRPQFLRRLPGKDPICSSLGFESLKFGTSTDGGVAVGIVTVGQTNPGSCSTSFKIPPANVGGVGVAEIPTTFAVRDSCSIFCFCLRYVFTLKTFLFWNSRAGRGAIKLKGRSLRTSSVSNS